MLSIFSFFLFKFLLEKRNRGVLGFFFYHKGDLEAFLNFHYTALVCIKQQKEFDRSFFLWMSLLLTVLSFAAQLRPGSRGGRHRRWLPPHRHGLQLRQRGGRWASSALQDAAGHHSA